jgi:hypothetical protein
MQKLVGEAFRGGPRSRPRLPACRTRALEGVRRRKRAKTCIMITREDSLSRGGYGASHESAGRTGGESNLGDPISSILHPQLTIVYS